MISKSGVRIIPRIPITGSIPIFLLQSHKLVYIKNYLFIIGIGPICDKELICTFDMFLLFVWFIENRYKYYKINIRYTYVFNFFYNVIYLRCLLCFGADTETISGLLVKILFYLQNQTAMVPAIKSQLFILSTE